MFCFLGHSIWQPLTWYKWLWTETLDLVIQIGSEALARNETNQLVWVSCILIILFGTPFICHQWGSLSDMGMPPTWEKGSHLPPGTTKLGNLRDGCDLSQLPLPNQIFRILLLCIEPTQECQKCDRVLCTDTLGELVGSHTKVTIYPTYTICCKRLWSMPCLIPGSRGYR